MSIKIRKIINEITPTDKAISGISLILGIASIIGVPYPYNFYVLLLIFGFYLIYLARLSSIVNIIRDSQVELSDDWFRKKYEQFIEPFPDKFSFEAELYTKNDSDAQVHEFLMDYEFLISFEEWYNIIKTDLEKFEISLIKLSSDVPIELKKSSELDLIIKKAEELNEILKKNFDLISTIKNLLENLNIEKIKDIDLQQDYNSLENTFREYEKLERDFDFSKIDFKGDEEEINKQEQISRKIISKPANMSFRFINDLNAIINKLKVVNKVDLHILGDAGSGKSYMINSICKERLEKGLPFLVVSGRKFSNDSPIEEQLKILLDIPNRWEDFLDTLEKIAESKKTRLPIIIDGLNETTFEKAFSNLWRTHLPSFINHLKSRNNIVLITTCRTTYKDIIWSNSPINQVLVEELNQDEVEIATRKYFKFYKIESKLTIVDLTPFRNPLYLRIFCESTNPQRKENVKIRLSQKTIFQIFKEYVNISNQVVCDRLGINISSNVVESALYDLAEYLWKNNESYISHSELIKIVDNKTLDQLEKSKSKVFTIEDEGLLVCRDFRGAEEVVYFTYDLFGGYIISKYLLENEKDLKKFITSEKANKSLFNTDYKTLHPLHSDITRCLSALIPIQTNYLISDFSNNETIIISSLKALFEIPHSLINKKSINFLKDQFKDLNNRELIFSLFRVILADTENPLNSEMLSNLLLDLDIQNRDVSWTEFVRKKSNVFEEEISFFEKVCDENILLTEDREDVLALFARYIMWILTSTIRTLRDRATRALYNFGRIYPLIFFDLVQESFKINDPSVSERMLAATYGIAMHEQYDFNNESFSSEILPQFGEILYNLMFKKGAPYATTHILARDYSRKTIEIALVHHPNLLSEDEKKRINPPFKDGGIRKWGESRDKDKSKYSEGNAPLNDIMWDDVSLLGKGMDKYNQPPEYKKAQKNLFWRIYQFGYSLELFGDIDIDIIKKNRLGSYTDREMWATPYGRKYVLIAIKELAGLRDDLGLLRSDWEPKYQNTSLVDIDPSFPIELEPYDLIGNNFQQLSLLFNRIPSFWKLSQPILRFLSSISYLKRFFWNISLTGNPNIPVEKWISKKNIPNINGYLVMHEIDGRKGPWVLLDGHVSQRDKKIDRDIYIFPRGILFNANEEKNIIKKLKNQDLSHRWLPEIPEDHYTYAGEIPWSETFPENEWDEISFPNGYIKETEKIKRFGLFKNGERLNEDLESEFWEKLEKEGKCTIFYADQFVDMLMNLQDESNDENLDPAGFNEDLNVIMGKFGEKYLSKNFNPKEMLNAELTSKGLEMKIVDILVEKEVPNNDKYDVLIPVRENNWEMHHSPIIPSRNIATPNKQIAESLKLCKKSKRFDLFERNGSCASITIQYESSNQNQNFTYIRKDLFDQYLSENNLKFIWGIWGAKEYFPDDISKIHAPKTFEREHPFYWIKEYKK